LIAVRKHPAPRHSVMSSVAIGERPAKPLARAAHLKLEGLRAQAKHPVGQLRGPARTSTWVRPVVTLSAIIHLPALD